MTLHQRYAADPHAMGLTLLTLALAALTIVLAVTR